MRSKFRRDLLRGGTNNNSGGRVATVYYASVSSTRIEACLNQR